MNDMPQCFLVTGAIGSGKTFITASLLAEIAMPYVNPDLYFQYLITCQCCSADERYDRARNLCKARISRLIGERQSFAWETVLASPWKWDILSKCRESHLITVIFLEVQTPQICIKRARRRAATGWYDVPQAKILDSYSKMSQVRPRLQELANIFIALDNSKDLI